MRAIDEATLILQRAQIMTSCGLKMGQGEELTEEDLEKIREVNSRT